MGFRNYCLIALAGALLNSIAFADDAANREKLIGTWQAQEGTGAAKAVWILEFQDGVFHIANSMGDKKLVEFACGLAKECEGKDGGRKVKVTLYFNGSKLVVTETKGDDIVKRRFGAGEKGDTLELEVIPVASTSKAETLHLTRAANH